MEVFDFFGKVNIPKGTALCLGNFDGVHLGHRQLFNAAKAFGKWGVLVFDGDFKGEKLITTISEKLGIIEKLGADYVIVATPSPEFFGIEWEDFYHKLKTDFGIGMLSVGYDYRFGKGAEGTVQKLIMVCEKDGIKIHIEDVFSYRDKPVKSTAIREYIANGDIDDANRLLGYEFVVSGEVIKGFQNGTKMGIPTANISCGAEKLLPPDGVYKGRFFAEGFDENGLKALINIGKNPTFDGKKRTVEVHIPGINQPLYGKYAKVSFTAKIRDEIRFDSVDALVGQIKKDIETAISE